MILFSVAIFLVGVPSDRAAAVELIEDPWMVMAQAAYEEA